jgi:hypothetical protein
MYPRKKVGTYSFWNYAVPPRTLMDSLHLERALINQDESSRAVWFWNRRPKLLCETLTSVSELINSGSARNAQRMIAEENGASHRITRKEYEKLASFRFYLRRFLRFSEMAARSLALMDRDADRNSKRGPVKYRLKSFVPSIMITRSTGK